MCASFLDFFEKQTRIDRIKIKPVAPPLATWNELPCLVHFSCRHRVSDRCEEAGTGAAEEP